MTRLELSSPLSHPLGREEISSKVSKLYPSLSGLRCEIVKRSTDCRKAPLYRYQVDVFGASEQPDIYTPEPFRDVSESDSAIVVGAGPAGMFAALKLLSLGIKPIVLERGADVHRRKFDMATLSKTGLVNPESNYCFGEGGAGAFSDGKLYTRSTKRGDNREVLARLVEFGADESVLFESHPHIGSDKLPTIVENIRNCIISHGGEYRFNTRVTSVSRENGFCRVLCADGSEYRSKGVILATGHSARDVYEFLIAKGAALEQKGFALGVRCEHPQSIINDAQYKGKFSSGMPSAEYSFAQQVGGRGVFSFCMCPGGILVPSSTVGGTVVLNGMSNSARNSQWANAGVVVQIEPGDVPGDKGPLGLLDFQMGVERRAYEVVSSTQGGLHPLCAPAQRMVDFCKGVESSDLPRTSYHPGACACDLSKVLPDFVATRLKAAFPNVKIPGYYTNEALLLGVESRTSSPVRVLRDLESLECVGLEGVYPCGEGAGYSGGIVSSAIDGIRCALALKQKYYEA